MISLDDYTDDGDKIILIEEQKPKPIKGYGFFTGAGKASPIIYNTMFKTFIPGYSVDLSSAFLGWMYNYNQDTDLVDVIYKGFLMKDPYKISLNLKPQYMQANIRDLFELARKAIIENMPRVKRLKRINLKMLTREHALFIYYHLDELIKLYEIIYGYEKGQYLKAQITTLPFYIDDNGIIKLYDMQTNELKVPDLDTPSGWFLAYFSFVNKTEK